jgi:filamentous hemagglutinin
MRADNAPSSLIAGGDVLVTAPGDIALQGSVVGAGGVAEILAGRDLALLPGSEAQERRHEHRSSSFGFGFSSGGGGASVSLGLARERLLEEQGRDSAVGSLVGGGEGVLLEAGRDLTVIAAEITSPADIALIAGRDLDILPGAIVERHRRVESRSFAGITASVGTNVVDAARRLGDSVAVFGSGHGDARYQALGMVSGVLQGVDAVRDLSNPGVSASLSIGASSSRFEEQSRFDGVVPARIEAGGDLALIAGRDMAIAALQARAGGDLDLYAGRNLAIESAMAAQTHGMRHSATSASLGIDLGWQILGSSSAGGGTTGLSLSANHARGSQTGAAASHVDADLRAGERLSLLTGNDALVAGAQLRGREILLDIGGDLHVASRADTAQLRGSSFNAGFGLNIGLGAGAGSGLNLSLGGGRERADSSLINQQTSIIADERLDARIEGHTQLDGGLIASLDGDLTLDTGTFGYSDITERARSDTRRATLNLGFGGGSPSIGVEGELAHAATDAITRATVGEGEIIIRDEDAQRAREEAGETRDIAALNRDLDAAREILRDERAGVRFYASDSAIVELGSGFETTLGNLRALSERLSSVIENLSEDHGERLEELAEAMPEDASDEEKAAALADDLVARGEITEEQRDAEREAIIADAYMILSDPDVIDEVIICEDSGRQGFNLHDLLFPRAHANPAIPLIIRGCIAAGQWVARTMMAKDIADRATDNVSQMVDNSGRPGRGHNQGPRWEDDQTSGQQQGPDGPQTPRPPGELVAIGSLAYIAQHGLPSKDDVIANPLLLPSQIHDGSQGKHIPSHNNFDEFRSPLLPNVSPSELLRAARHREAPLVGRSVRGDPIFDFGRPIGTSGGSQTTYGTVHFSKRGAHIVPVQKVRP